jgi:hypothetical protein
MCIFVLIVVSCSMILEHVMFKREYLFTVYQQDIYLIRTILGCLRMTLSAP